MNTNASMPSNIALIKYMGKSKLSSNQAANASISLTLPHLKSTCHVTSNKLNKDRFIVDPRTPLTEAEQAKALKQVARIKAFFKTPTCFMDITAYNNFPASCGLASSASSTAAITQATAQFICEATHIPMPDTITIANLSQLGSGSSCRSFFAPLALWDGAKKTTLSCPINIHHRVILISSEIKKIASSVAHAIISKSDDLPHRIDRANLRVQQLIPALKTGNWSIIRDLTEADSKDMHNLLEKNDICYRNQAVYSCFAKLKSFIQAQPSFQPITTMDAGPNIHVLLRDEDLGHFEAFLSQYKLSEALI
jgi:diphosphomevalonate decarboxylase